MELVIRDARGEPQEQLDTPAAIAERLAPLGLAVGQLAVHPGPPRPQVADVQGLAALHRRFGIRHADRFSLAPGDGHWPALRAQFRRRHRHADHEIRVFVAGRGLFELPLAGGALAQLVCEAGDWVALPPGQAHAFDAGQRPRFDALRLFAQAEGWQAQPSEDAERAPLPDLDRFLAALRCAA